MKESLMQKLIRILGYDGYLEWKKGATACRGLASYNQTPAHKQSKRKRKSTNRRKK